MQDQMRMFQALAGMMKHKDDLKAGAERVKQRLATETVDAETAGVRVRATCTFDIVSVDAEPGVLSGPEAGTLITSAVNASLAAARDRAKAITQEEMRALNIPGLEELLTRQGEGGFGGSGMGSLGGLLG